MSFPLTYLLDGNPFVMRGRARDIGGGGMYFESDEDESVPENTSMTIWFELRPGLKLEVRGRPVVSYYADELHRHRIAFSGIPDAVRDSILAHVFDAWRADVLSRSDALSQLYQKAGQCSSDTASPAVGWCEAPHRPVRCYSCDTAFHPGLTLDVLLEYR